MTNRRMAGYLPLRPAWIQAFAPASSPRARSQAAGHSRPWVVTRSLTWTIPPFPPLQRPLMFATGNSAMTDTIHVLLVAADRHACALCGHLHEAKEAFLDL